MNTPIVLTHHFSATIDRVYRAFTTPADLQQWAWGSIGVELIADVDVRVGGAMNISTMRPEGSRWTMSGKYTDIVPNKILAHTLQLDAPMGYESDDEHVTVEFEERDGGTQVTFTHIGVPSAEARAEHVGGWNNCFEVLEQYLQRESRG